MRLQFLHKRFMETNETLVSSNPRIQCNALEVADARLRQIVLPVGHVLPDGSRLREQVRLSNEVIVTEIQNHLEDYGFSFSYETIRSTFWYVVTHVDAAHHLLAGVYFDQEAGKLKIGRLFRKVLWSYASNRQLNGLNLAKELVEVDYGRFNGDETLFQSCSALFGAEERFAFYDSNKDWVVDAIDKAKKRMWFRSDCYLDDWVCFVYAATETLLLRYMKEVEQELSAGNLRERAIGLLCEEFSKQDFSLEEIPQLAQERQVRWTKGLTEEDCNYALQLLFQDDYLSKIIIDALVNCRKVGSELSHQIGRMIGMQGGMIGRNCTGDYIMRKPGELNKLKDDPMLLSLASGLIAAINGIVAEGRDCSLYKARLEESQKIKNLIRRDLGLK